MRTTLNLAPETHEFVAYYASARGISLSAAIDELVQKAQAAPPPPSPEIRRSPNGLPLLPRTGQIITSEMVKRYSEDEYEFDPEIPA